MMRREEQYVGRRVMELKVQGIPKRRSMVGQSEGPYDRATWRRMSAYIDPT